MNIGILGTGVVGTTLGTALAANDHAVLLGSRTADNPKAVEWATTTGGNASHGTFADAAAHGEIVINCLLGSVTVGAVTPLVDALDGKILIDVSNPLDFSSGFPRVTTVDGNSLGQQLQAALPKTFVVKTLNNLSANVMVDPARVRAQTLFLSADSASAKDRVRGLLREFGWEDADIIDIGGIETAATTEAFVPLWVLLMQTLGTTDFGVHVGR